MEVSESAKSHSTPPKTIPLTGKLRSQFDAYAKQRTALEDAGKQLSIAVQAAVGTVIAIWDIADGAPYTIDLDNLDKGITLVETEHAPTGATAE